MPHLTPALVVERAPLKADSNVRRAKILRAKTSRAKTRRTKNCRG
jgi:hypothetical protein